MNARDHMDCAKDSPATCRNLTHDPRSGITLVEVPVVITIIAALIAMLLPAVQSARESARRVTCSNQIKQFALALHGYHQSDRSLPSGIINQNRGHAAAFTNTAWQAIATPRHLVRRDPAPARRPGEVRPLQLHTAVKRPGELVGRRRADGGCRLSERPKRRLIDLPEPLQDLHKPPEADQMLGLWFAGSLGINPLLNGCMCCTPTTPAVGSDCCTGSDRGFFITTGGTTSTATGMFAVTATKISFDSVRDGLSTTILLGETLPHENMHNGAFTTHYPVIATNIPLNTFVLPNEWPITGVNLTNYSRISGIKSRHPGGAHVAMGDGAVHYFSDDIDFLTLRTLGTRRGNEVVGLP